LFILGLRGYKKTGSVWKDRRVAVYHPWGGGSQKLEKKVPDKRRLGWGRERNGMGLGIIADIGQRPAKRGGWEISYHEGRVSAIPCM